MYIFFYKYAFKTTTYHHHHQQQHATKSLEKSCEKQ